MAATPHDLDILRRRLAWRASRRGIKEMDIVVGGYAKAHLSTMSASDLAQFETLLEIPDQQLLSWLTGQETVPSHLTSPMLADMLAFRLAMVTP